LSHKRIEICGGIASGKTSLTKLLEISNIGTPIYENFQSNYFWKAFYQNPGKYIFETEISFTLQHYHEIKKQTSSNLLICDYSLLLDHAYAMIGLADKKLDLYIELLKEIYNDISTPDLLIYLECNEKEELKRIKYRNRKVETNIKLDFLRSLNNEIKKDIKKETHILTINSEQYNFVNNDKDKQYVIELIKSKINLL
jgi:deoxyadenosine/deoxycytidine kinase